MWQRLQVQKIHSAPTMATVPQKTVRRKHRRNTDKLHANMLIFLTLQQFAACATAVLTLLEILINNTDKEHVIQD